MNWKRTARWSWFALPFLLLAVWPGDAAAGHKSRPAPPPCTKLEAGQACLYEVTEEAVFLDALGNPTGDPEDIALRAATAALMGRLVGVFPGCEQGCDIVALAGDLISLAGLPFPGPGLGVPLGAANCPANASASVCGEFAIVVNEPGSVDAAEVVVAKGFLHGNIDLSPAVVGGVPLGSISNGVWGAQGVNPATGVRFLLGGTFTGTFRLPFTNDGQVKNFWKRFHFPRRGIVPASYLLDSGKKVPVRLDERSLAAPTVRLEVQFSIP